MQLVCAKTLAMVLKYSNNADYSVGMRRYKSSPVTTSEINEITPPRACPGPLEKAECAGPGEDFRRGSGGYLRSTGGEQSP